MIVVGEGKLNKYRLVKRIYEYFLDSATKDAYGYCDTSIVGFLVLWSLFGYGLYLTIVAIIGRFFA